MSTAPLSNPQENPTYPEGEEESGQAGEPLPAVSTEEGQEEELEKLEEEKELEETEVPEYTGDDIMIVWRYDTSRGEEAEILYPEKERFDKVMMSWNRYLEYVKEKINEYVKEGEVVLGDGTKIEVYVSKEVSVYG